jgi:hypothetical protein
MLITGWAAGALLSQQLALWCIRFVRQTYRSTLGGWIAVTPAFLGRVLFTAACVVCVVMDLRYAYHLAVFVWPPLGETLAPL